MKWETFLRIERWDTSNSPKSSMMLGNQEEFSRDVSILVTICFYHNGGNTHTRALTHTHPYTLSLEKQKWHPLLCPLKLTLKPHPHCNKMFPKGADRLTQGHASTSLFPGLSWGSGRGKWAWTPGAETCLLSSPIPPPLSPHEAWIGLGG